MAKVSVCMVTYNHAKYIREAIEGVLMQQTDFEVELIIGNDSSPDDTDAVIAEIIKTHPKGNQINYFNHAQNKGIMRNFAFILEQCKGTYIALCDGDDYWTDPKKLQVQVDFLDHHPEYVLCFHKIKILQTDGKIVSDFLTNVPGQHENVEDLARFGNYIHTPSVVYRNIITKIPFEFYNSPIGDFFMYIMLAHHGKLKYLEAEMCVYRHGVGFFSQQADGGNALNLARFYSCLLSYLEREDLKKIIYQRQVSLLEAYHDSAKYKFSSNNYLSKNKSFADIAKIIAKKITGK